MYSQRECDELLRRLRMATEVASCLGISSKPVLNFPRVAVRKLLKIPLRRLPRELKCKLAELRGTLTVEELNTLLRSLAETALEVSALQQAILLFTANRLLACLRAAMSTSEDLSRNPHR